MEPVWQLTQRSRGHGKHVTHLQPSEQAMDVWGPRNESPTCTNPLSSAKPPEEEEHVANADPLLCQVTLCSTNLAKTGPPARLSGYALRTQVWIKMDQFVCADPARREV